MFKAAPLSSGFMLASIVGFFISVIYIYPKSVSWGFTFALIFTFMFLASVVSMSYAPVEAELHLDFERRKEAIKKAKASKPTITIKKARATGKRR